jgi:hypothetical protein
MDDAITRISSVYKFGAPLRGLEPEEEKKLLPMVSNLDPEASTWRHDANRFWAEVSIKVASDGVELEAGVDEHGMPLKPLDYIQYQFCLRHPLVAADEDELKKKASYRFYIYDPDRAVAKRHDSVELKATAYALFSKIKAAEDSSLSFSRILRLNGLNPDKMSLQALETSVANFLEATPAKFIALAEDRDLADTALIEEMVDQNVLRKLGTVYLFGDIRIGDSLAEAVAYIGSAKNSKHFVTMLAQLQEKRKATGLSVSDIQERMGVKPATPAEQVLEQTEDDIADVLETVE